MLFLVFLVLKLTGVIGWSWWWVTVPLWGPITLVAAVWILISLFAGLFLSVAFLADLMGMFGSKRKR